MVQSAPETTLNRLDDAVRYVRERWPHTPTLGVIAGSGLGLLGDLATESVRMPYGTIPHMPTPSVVGHSGELVVGTLAGLRVAILSGRVHHYEGWPMGDVVFGARLLARLGCESVVLTNAAGGIHPWLLPGSLCRIVDHLNLMGANPLGGPNVEGLGPRFPDMSAVYDRVLGDRLDRAAAARGVVLGRGVYAAMSGPSYETPAEIRMLRVLGADLVGMSTVPEAIALRHMGVRVGGVSVVSNHAAGVSAELLSHDDVKHVALDAGPRLVAVLEALARALAEEPLAGAVR